MAVASVDGITWLEDEQAERKKNDKGDSKTRQKMRDETNGIIPSDQRGSLEKQVGREEQPKGNEKALLQRNVTRSSNSYQR